MLVLVLFSFRSCTTLGLVRKETGQLNAGCSREWEDRLCCMLHLGHVKAYHGTY